MNKGLLRVSICSRCIVGCHGRTEAVLFRFTGYRQFARIWRSQALAAGSPSVWKQSHVDALIDWPNYLRCTTGAHSCRSEKERKRKKSVNRYTYAYIVHLNELCLKQTSNEMFFVERAFAMLTQKDPTFKDTLFSQKTTNFETWIEKYITWKNPYRFTDWMVAGPHKLLLTTVDLSVFEPVASLIFSIQSRILPPSNSLWNND